MSSQPGWIRVAAGLDDFQDSLGCRMCVQITGSGKGSGTDPVTGVIKAIVHDKCVGCGKGDIIKGPYEPTTVFLQGSSAYEQRL